MGDGKDAERQRERCIDVARQLGADESGEAFQAKLTVIARQKPKAAAIDASSFDKGVDAHRAGGDVTDNPFEKGQPEQHEWAQGWHAAEARSRG